MFQLNPVITGGGDGRTVYKQLHDMTWEKVTRTRCTATHPVIIRVCLRDWVTFYYGSNVLEVSKQRRCVRSDGGGGNPVLSVLKQIK